MDSLWQFVTQYGYWAVVLGGLVEGETLLILAGFAARLGHLELPAVMAVGAFMGALSDILLFSLGRWRGKQVLARWPRVLRYRRRFNRLVARWGMLVVIGMRFMYGMRWAGPILVGMSNMSWPRFLAFNLVGAALWGFLAAGAGWMFGAAAQAVLADAHEVQGWVLGALVVLALALAGWRGWRARQRRERDARAVSAPGALEPIALPARPAGPLPDQ
ncbi:MAG: DedA family protein [Pseudomonadota bacterium]|nr:DedA family protein [Pseudomonadota bacterium]